MSDIGVLNPERYQWISELILSGRSKPANKVAKRYGVTCRYARKLIMETRKRLQRGEPIVRENVHVDIYNDIQRILDNAECDPKLQLNALKLLLNVVGRPPIQVEMKSKPLFDAPEQQAILRAALSQEPQEELKEVPPEAVEQAPEKIPEIGP